jgi:alpha-tubulin suppressor-like RCC1 family protein
MPNTGYKTHNKDLDDSILTKEELLRREFTPGTLWGTGEIKGFEVFTSGLSRSSPIQIIGPNLEGFKEWTRISVGNFGGFQATQSVYAIKNNGTLWYFGPGNNTSPRLAASGNSMMQVSVVDGIGTGESYAIDAYGYLGNLNNNGPEWSPLGADRRLPSSNTCWKTVSAGSNFFGGLASNNALITSGGNSYGQLGNNTVVDSLSVLVLVTSAENWKNIDCGYLHTAAIKTDGTLWTWGRNDEAQLGDGTIIHRSSPVQVGSDTTWKLIACGYNSSAAIKTNGTLWTWGRNEEAQLGVNDRIYRSSPTQVGSSTDWKQVHISRSFGGAVKTDGTLWTWGQNNIGQLGLNNTVARSSPAQVGANTYWKQVGCSADLYNDAAGLVRSGTSGSGYLIFLTDGSDFIDSAAN